MIVKSTEKLENGKVSIEIQVEKAEFDAAMDRSFKKNVSKITVPGFRKGKAPRRIIERMYGEHVFTEDALNFAYPPAYEQAIAELGFEPVDRADVDIVDLSADGFVFKAVVTVKPEVKLGAYTGLTADKVKPEVTELDIQRELDQLRMRNSRLVSVDRAAKENDTVVIDFEGFVDGVAFEGGKAEKHNLKLGSGQFIPGFEDQLIGAAAGAEVDVNVTFPTEYQADDLAGKEAVFKVKVHEVKETEEPVMDDEFAKDVSEFDTMDELKKSIETKLMENREQISNDGFENLLLDQIIANMEVEIPDVMIENQLDRITDDFANRMMSQGISMESYLQMSGTDMESFRKNFRESAERQVKITLALEAITKAENLEIIDADIEAEYTKLSEQYGMPVDRIKSYIPREAMLQDMKSLKASEFIRNNSKANLIAPDAPKKKKTTTKKKAADEAETAEKKPAAKKASTAKSTTTKTAAKSTAAKKTTTTAKKTTAKASEKPAEKAAPKKRTTTKKADAE